MTSQNIFKTMLIFTIILFASFANAAIYRVNGLGGADADFTTIQAAVSTAADGDTLYIEGFPNYAGWTATKKLTYIGPGYFLGDNPETQANTTPAKITAAVTIDVGAEGSVLTGLSFSNYLYIYADSTIIKRNHFTHYINIGMSNKYPSDIIFKQNYVAFASSYSITVYNYCHNILFFNNFIWCSNYSYTCISSGIYSSVIVDHNVVYGEVTLYNSVFSNNIMYNGEFSGDYNGYYNNVCNAAQLTADNGNILDKDMTTVFKLTGSTDGKYQLKTGSPAIGADAENGDCGMFGGTDPYVLSGVPSELPTIYYFYNSGSGTTVSGLPIHLKAKTRD